MKRYILLILSAVTLLCSCINNDLPYPVILGNVEVMEVEGQSELKIDALKRTIEITLDDSVDIRAIKILELDITPDSKCTIDSGEVIDLTNGSAYEIGEPYKFTISTFQDYEWTIEATQPIKREITLSGSIGDALFDVNNKTAVVKVGLSQDLYDIKVETFVLGPAIATYSPDPFTISDFSEDVHIDMTYFGITENWTVIVQYSFENVLTGTPNAWSSFAYLYGDVLPTSTEAAGFEYKEAAGDDWVKVDAQSKSGKIEAVATDLKPNSKYIFKAFLGGDYGAEVEFTTDNEPSIPNLSFDDAVFVGKSWYFNASGENSYWATGNDGVITAGKAPSSTSVSGSDAVAGRAVRMVTYNDVLMVKVAAGNLFTGTYKTVMSAIPSEALKSATFGRPYKGRPTALKGWYRYTPAKLTSSSYWPAAATAFGNNFADSIGKSDWCQIYMVLEKWPDGAEVRPENQSLITRIAYGEIRTNKNVPSYTPFTIPLKYYVGNEKPTHVSIVASSSLNGGYFCGAAGSVLYVDEFELVFDYIEP